MGHTTWTPSRYAGQRSATTPMRSWMLTLAIAVALVAVGAMVVAHGLWAGIGWAVVLGGLAVGSRVNVR